MGTNVKDARAPVDGMISQMAGRGEPPASALEKPVATRLLTEAGRRPTLTLRSEAGSPKFIQQMAIGFSEGKKVGALKLWRLLARRARTSPLAGSHRAPDQLRYTTLALLHDVRVSNPSALQDISAIIGVDAPRLKGAKVVDLSVSAKGPDVALIYTGSRTMRTIWDYLACRLDCKEGLNLIADAAELGANSGARRWRRCYAPPAAPLEC